MNDANDCDDADNGGEECPGSGGEFGGHALTAPFFLEVVFAGCGTVASIALRNRRLRTADSVRSSSAALSLSRKAKEASTENVFRIVAMRQLATSYAVRQHLMQFFLTMA
mgnify:FL=1